MTDLLSTIWYVIKFLWFIIVTCCLISLIFIIFRYIKEEIIEPEEIEGKKLIIFYVHVAIVAAIAIIVDFKYVYPESNDSNPEAKIQIVNQETPKVQREIPVGKHFKVEFDNTNIGTDQYIYTNLSKLSEKNLKFVLKDIPKVNQETPKVQRAVPVGEHFKVKFDNTNIGTDQYIYTNLSKLSEKNLKFVLKDISSMSGSDVEAYNHFYEIANDIIDNGNLGTLLNSINIKRSEIKNNKAIINEFNYKKIELSEKELAVKKGEIDRLKSQNERLNHEISEIITKMHLTQTNPKIIDVLIRLSPKQKLIKFYIFNEIIMQMPDMVSMDSNEVKKKFLEIQILLHRLSNYIIKDALGELDVSINKINKHIENTEQHINTIIKQLEKTKYERNKIQLNKNIETDNRLLKILNKVKIVIEKLINSFDVKKEMLDENLDLVLIEYDGALNMSSVSSDLDNISSLKEVINGFSMPELDSEFINDLTNDELDRLEEIFQ